MPVIIWGKKGADADSAIAKTWGNMVMSRPDSSSRRSRGL